MSEMSELISVTFVDQTSYTPDTGEDVVGTAIEHCWGPINQVNVYNIRTFLSTFPEAHPIGAAVNSPVAYLGPWAQLRRALKAGASAVETVRIQGNWKYTQMNVVPNPSPSSGDPLYILESSETTNQFDLEALLSLATKYPGRPAKSGIYADYKSLRFEIQLLGEDYENLDYTDVIPQIIINVYGNTGTSDILIATHAGSFDEQSMLDGRSFYIKNVLERDSLLLEIKINEVPSVTVTEEHEYEWEEMTIPTAVSASTFSNFMTASFANSETSTSTLLLCPLNGNNDLNSNIASVVSDRKDCNFIVGFPLLTQFTRAEILSFSTDDLPNASFDMFTLFLAAREVFTVCGKTIEMDGTAGYAGAISRIASQIRINQMPSARAYGSFDGTLVETLRFDEVLELHKKGINSIYTSTVGAQIFGIRDRHPRQTSYFAKSNVSRVTARFLRVVFPVILEVIHTETVSDPINLAQLETTLSRIVDTFISQRNIRPESSVDLSNNSDEESNGGEVLNVNFNLWFKKLTEKVNIQIIATDSSVTATVN